MTRSHRTMARDPVLPVIYNMFEEERYDIRADPADWHSLRDERRPKS